MSVERYDQLVFVNFNPVLSDGKRHRDLAPSVTSASRASGLTCWYKNRESSSGFVFSIVARASTTSRLDFLSDQSQLACTVAPCPGDSSMAIRKSTSSVIVIFTCWLMSPQPTTRSRTSPSGISGSPLTRHLRSQIPCRFRPWPRSRSPDRVVLTYTHLGELSCFQKGEKCQSSSPSARRT